MTAGNGEEGRLRQGPVPTPQALDQAQRIQALIASQLADVRKAADSWRTGLLAMLALLGTIVVVKGRESFENLTSPAPYVIGALLGLALLAAIYGSLQAMRAAYGDPKPRVTSGVLTWDYQDSAKAVDALRAARRAFVGSLLLAAAAIALTWYWPSEMKSKVRADFAGTPVCGTLVSADATTIVIKEDGSEKSNPASGLRSLVVVAAC